MEQERKAAGGKVSKLNDRSMELFKIVVDGLFREHGHERFDRLMDMLLSFKKRPPFDIEFRISQAIMAGEPLPEDLQHYQIGGVQNV